MGKQINYWLGYADFLKIAQAALDSGCVIIKRAAGEWIYEQTLAIVTEDEHDYWFYVPEAGALSGRAIPFKGDELLRIYSPAGNTVIKAGFSFLDDKRKTIARSRLFVISGYYDERGEYIPRPACVTKVYHKLARIAKKVAPLTELTDPYTSTRDGAYLQELERKHKEYITPAYLHLRNAYGYKLKG